ncbi:hypothetical protein FDECE_18318, partial [Fusarium decemcellulare]
MAPGTFTSSGTIDEVEFSWNTDKLPTKLFINNE